MTVGVDVGGTFTDLARWDGGRLTTAKVPTTAHQGAAVAAGVRQATGGHRDRLLLHGTTTATNALLERRGARIVLVTDSGFEDLIEIGRQDRPSLYDPFADRPEPLVPRTSRLGWSPGVDVADLMAGVDPESIAVALLNSYRDGSIEDELADLISRVLPAVPVSVSHRISGEFREYERIATAVLNAYLRPAVASYLEALTRDVANLAGRVLVMQSSGGLTTAASAAGTAASIVLSGPAAGVVAAAACGGAHGWNRVISFDMGGTSTDVCRIEGGVPEAAAGRLVGGVPCRLPSLAIHTVGAGGGSIGWADAGGALRVGPHSAGADPGPAAYSRGGSQPTVTDANLAAGRLGTETPLAGGIRLDRGSALVALGTLATGLDLDLAGTATGVLEVVNAVMARAIRQVSIEQGADPRQAPLLAFGGAGGLHASGLARRLDMPAVIVPPHAGVFSALGLLLSPVRHDGVRTVMLAHGDPSLGEQIDSIRGEVRRGFREATGSSPGQVEVSADVRYPGQSHETPIAVEEGDGWQAVAARFHRAHHDRNGFSWPDRPLELVTLRAAATAPPALTWQALPGPRPAGPARLGDRSLPDGTTAARWRRDGLAPGAEVVGPAVIQEAQATLWVGGGERAVVLADGSIEVTW